MPNKSPPEKLFGFIPELSSAPNFCHKFKFEQKVLEEENLASAEPGMIISWGTLVYFLVRKISFSCVCLLILWWVSKLLALSHRLGSNMSATYEMMLSNGE